MKELTSKEVEGKMSWTDVVKYYRPKWSDEECDTYLWEETCYPFSSESTLLQINNQLSKS